MPKQRITREMVVDAAFEIARAEGMEQVLVKSIAARLGCSVQPIYSYCDSMEGLRQAVTDKTAAFAREYIAARLDKDDLFRSFGEAFLQLAKEEPNLFKIYTLRPREDISSMDELYRKEARQGMAEYISRRLGISVEAAKQLHLNMLIYTTGLGTIFSVTSPGISVEEIFAQQKVAYDAFLAQAENTKGDCLKQA